MSVTQALATYPYLFSGVLWLSGLLICRAVAPLGVPSPPAGPPGPISCFRWLTPTIGIQFERVVGPWDRRMRCLLLT